MHGLCSVIDRRGVVGGQIVRETDRLWWLWCALRAQSTEYMLGGKNKKKQYHRTTVSLQTTTVGQCACVFLACAHSVMCAGYQVVDQEERWSREKRFLSHPQGGQTTDTHLKGNKTAPTTSKSCCILFSSEETRVIRSPPPICSPYV